MLIVPQVPLYALVVPAPAWAIPRSYTSTLGLETNSSSVVTVSVMLFLVKSLALSREADPVPVPPDNVAVTAGWILSTALANDPVEVELPAISDTDPTSATFGVLSADIEAPNVKNTCLGNAE